MKKKLTREVLARWFKRRPILQTETLMELAKRGGYDVPDRARLYAVLSYAKKAGEVRRIGLRTYERVK